MRIKIKGLIFVSLVLLVSCDWESGDARIPDPGGYARWHEVTGFELIYSFPSYAGGSNNRLCILYGKTFSGDIRYIVSTENLQITSEAEFTADPAAKTDVTIVADDEVHNDYIALNSLSPDTTYYVYILDETTGEVTSLSKTTHKNNGSTQKTGTITQLTGNGTETASITYYINYPSDYDPFFSKKWPLLLSIKSPDFTEIDNNFPCITFSINISWNNSTQYNSAVENLKKRIKSIIESPLYSIDKSRLYAVGFSAGGCAAMEIANNDGSSRYSFSAVEAVGISTYIGQYYSDNLKNKDIWLFWGENDTQWGPETVAAFNYMPGGSGEHLLTELVGAGHQDGPAWESPYSFMWLLSK